MGEVAIADLLIYITFCTEAILHTRDISVKKVNPLLKKSLTRATYFTKPAVIGRDKPIGDKT